jgi:dihydrofolate reductase
MNLSIIVAMANNRVIGTRGQLPWHIPEDLKRFKRLTMGHPIVMGRKTFESIGRPLPGRENVVLTRNPSFRPAGVTVLHDFGGWTGRFGDAEVFVIGGADLFRLALPLASRLYLTQIDRDFEGDTRFPEFDLGKDYDIVEKSEMKAEGGIPYRFVTAVRKSRP